MLNTSAVKGALLLAAIITGILVPLTMLLVSAPNGDEASEGLPDLAPTTPEILISALGIVIVFVVVFAIVLMVLRWIRVSSRD